MENKTIIEEYISRFDGEIKEILQKVYDTVRSELQSATEKISYRMPTFWHKENLIHFAASKNHIGVYPTPSGIEAFADRLTEYKTSKGAIQFPYSRPIPYELIAEIARFRLAEVEGTH